MPPQVWTHIRRSRIDLRDSTGQVWPSIIHGSRMCHYPIIDISEVACLNESQLPTTTLLRRSSKYCQLLTHEQIFYKKVIRGVQLRVQSTDKSIQYMCAIQQEESPTTTCSWRWYRYVLQEESPTTTCSWRWYRYVLQEESTTTTCSWRWYRYVLQEESTTTTCSWRWYRYMSCSSCLFHIHTLNQGYQSLLAFVFLFIYGYVSYISVRAVM